MTELPKTFDPAAIEARWYGHWEEKGLFRPDRPDAEPFTIVIPPPNVTGSLHIGHALDNTLQDILIRHARLQGKDSLWVVGTDHAGIATQMVVERNLESQGVRRSDMPREAFVEHVWEWKAQSGGQITRQLRRLGASCDWGNERFTMDPGFSAAVVRVFVQLHREGLLYRDKRLVNWDPKFRTAISDLEVETREVQGKFWHLVYPLAEGEGAIRVATTRPETMLADMAVAVHPDDKRYAALVGSKLRHPITGRLIPVIADEHADPELGSGAVKITPGHDFNDFEVGKRAGMRPADMLNMLDSGACVVQAADGLIPDELIGLDRFEARSRVVEMLEAEGALEKVEDRIVQLPYGDRSGVVIEPWLTDQWYVDAATLAKPAIEAVRSGDTHFVPRTWEKTYFNWMENIQPWCVSRQLWWGHRIPAWYDDQGKVYVAETEEEARRLAGDVPLRQDEDVLDTWFSSALWPFATLGWPEATPELKRHYPGSVLVTGFDIIFFWVARMMMQGLHFMEEVPFRTVYCHGLVRDSKGQKMAKSKGNTVDPLGLIDRYGADALRFTLAAMESQGRDIKLDEKRIEGYRNFATKLWNAARFCQANGIGASQAIEPPAATLPVNKWIVGETVKTVQALDLAMADLRFDESANLIYHFVWASFCDWYLELIKPVLSPLPPAGGDQGVGASEASQGDPTPAPSREREGGEEAETRTVAGWVLDQILVMLHPFMPFITEELWHAMGERPYELILAKWPMPDARALDSEAGAEIEWLIRLVSAVRAAKVEINVPPGARTDLWVLQETIGKLGPHSTAPSELLLRRIEGNRGALARMARLDVITFFNSGVQYDLRSGEKFDRTQSAITINTPGMQIVVDEATFLLPLEGVIDLDAERGRLTKAAEAAEKERDSLAARLANPSFVERAKPEAVEKARADHDEKASDAERYRAALERLG